MSENEVNQYIDTMKPILYLMKITGILPFHLQNKDGITCFIASKTVSIISMAIYSFNLIFNARHAFQLMNQLSENFSLKVFLRVIPFLLIKLIIAVIPLGMWGKSKNLQDYWSKWRSFQDDYRKATGKVFISAGKHGVQQTAVIVVVFFILGQILGQFFIYRGTNHLIFITDSLNVTAFYFVGAYWVTNCICIRSTAQDVLMLGKRTLIKGEDYEKLRKITSLWLSLSELMYKFDHLHSILFLQYIAGVVVSLIIFAFVSMNFPTLIFQRREVELNALLICILLIFVICETAHSVRLKINNEQRMMLLSENTTHMNARMLQSVLSFLQTIQLKNPQINLNGYLVLNRSVFSSIIAVCINYLIILRQFATTK